MDTNTPQAGLSDQELIAQVRQGNTRAFRTIVERYQSQVAATIIGLIGNTPEAQDVGQEAFVRFFKSLDRFRGDAGVGTYITRIAINLSYNEIRRRSRHRQRHGGTDTQLAQAPDLADRTGSLEHRDIGRALSRLDPKYRSVAVLRLVNGHSTQEVATMLGIPVGTVLSRLSRAQKQLRELLAEYREEHP